MSLSKNESPISTSPLARPCYNVTNDICGICSHVVGDHDKSILCDKCDKWVHIGCNNISNETYEFYQLNDEEEFVCTKCKKNQCGICDKSITPKQKELRCRKCLNWVHIKCSSTSIIQYENYQINPEERFECKNCKKCGLCEKTIAINHRKLECSLCFKYVHIKCNKFDETDYNFYKTNKTMDFYCIKCIEANLPLTNLKEHEFELTIKGINIPDDNDVETLYLRDAQIRIVNKLNNLIIEYNNDISKIDDQNETDEIPLNDCSYFTIDEFKKKNFDEDKVFSILHLNIHSVEAHIEELRIVLQLLDFYFDFICLSESKITKGCDPRTDISLDNYQTPIGTPTEATKGGVLIYVKNGINFEPRDDLTIYKKKELESYFIEVIDDKSSNAIVGVIYRHPSMDETNFIDDFIQPLNDKLQTENKKLFIAGDFNFDFLNLDHSESSYFFETMMSCHLMPSILLPTKINTVKHTVIDNIFTNQINPDMKSGNLTIAISDHLPSFLIVPKKGQNHIPKKQDIYVRNVKKFDRVNFTLDYLSVDWKDKLDRYKNDVNKAFEFFYWKINRLLDKYLPWKKLTNKEYKLRYKPWINGEILNKIKDKNKKFNRFVHCKDPLQKESMKKSYKLLKNEITYLTRQRKKDYYHNYFTKNKTNLKKIWSGIKEVINIKNKTLSKPTCIKNNKQTISNPKEVANAFNDYFSNIADDILKNRKYNGNTSHRKYLTNPLDKTFVAYECDKTEVESIITTLKPHKGTGPNSLPTNILLMLKSEISCPLAIIFNISLNMGVFPNLLKMSETIPVFKKGSKMETCNYRPISLLSNINKLFEKIMFKRVYSFLESNKCIYNRQFGFRSKHSTTQTLIEITEKNQKCFRQ